MSPQASRKLEAGCPRCGVRIAQPFKYCPNCAYRLRPDVTAVTTGPVQSRRARRLLTGYLVAGTMLLLVILAGVRLFEEKEVFLGVAEQTGAARDSDVLILDRATGFRRVEGGDANWGVYLPPQGPVTEAVVDHAFELGVYEITNDQFYEFVVAYARKRGGPAPAWLYPPHWNRRTGNVRVRHLYPKKLGNLPVTSVDFQTALEFCGWFWEEKLGANPDLIVDLPTAHEFVRAGRGDNVEWNFPWKGRLEPDRANLDGALIAVNNCKRYGALGTESEDGFSALVGNAAEWVHGPDDAQTPVAAGWSFEDGARYVDWDSPEITDKPSPFDKRQLETIRGRRARLGFRIVLRTAPETPRFVSVTAGKVQHRETADGNPGAILPPWSKTRTRPSETPDGMEVTVREPRVSFESTGANVTRNFEIAQSEITNRQYLAFIVEMDEEPQNIREWLPESFDRLHPFGDWGPFMDHYGDPFADFGDPERVAEGDFANLASVAVFPGPYGPPHRVPFIFRAGAENEPVRGVTEKQAKAYAQWLRRKLKDGARVVRLPTVNEFLRAGRLDGRSPYPWGDNPLHPQLVCAGRRDDQNRPVSLSGRFGTGGSVIHGLAGNLPEIVTDSDSGGERILLAGGFYKLYAEHCTLDTFMDNEWDYVEYEAGGQTEQFWLAQYRGFRVVRVRF